MVIGVHRMDQTHLVGDAMEIGNGIGHPHAILPVLGPLPRRSHQFGNTTRKRKRSPLEELIGTICAVKFGQFRLPIKHVQIRGRPCHVQIDHPLGPSGKMRLARCERIVDLDRCGPQREIICHQSIEGDPTKPRCGLTQGMTSCLKLDLIKVRIHIRARVKKINQCSDQRFKNTSSRFKMTFETTVQAA